MTTVAPEEIARRLEKFREALAREQIDLAIVRTPVNLLYLGGSIQDGHLIISPEREPLYLVWRVPERASSESPIEVWPIKSFKELPQLIALADLPSPRRLGLEFRLPHSQILLYQRLFPQAEICDISHSLRLLRARKSPWELERLRQAGKQLAEVVAEVPRILREGMTELELAAELEARLRRRGHPGYLRMHGWNQEIHFGHILFGPSGTVSAYVNMPSGGYGPNYALPHGAGWQRLRRQDPLSIDLAGCVEGYMVDQTRLFALEGLPSKALAAYDMVEEIMHMVEEHLRPGESCEAIYHLALKRIEASPWAEGFMGLGSAKVSFLGHGIGLEIDEYPFLAKSSPFVLEAGMVVAVEPKIHLPDIGLVGLEDTFVVTEAGPERLTLSERGPKIIPI